MLRAAIIAALLLTSSGAMGADYAWFPAEKVAAAQALIEASGDGDQFLIAGRFVAGRPGNLPSGRSQACLDGLKVLDAKIAQSLSDFLVLTVLRVYVSRLTIEDMNGVTAFFLSPAGRRYRSAVALAANADPLRSPAL